MNHDLVHRLIFMSQIAKRAGLENLAAALAAAALEVKGMQWELTVLKQKRTRR